MVVVGGCAKVRRSGCGRRLSQFHCACCHDNDGSREKQRGLMDCVAGPRKKEIVVCANFSPCGWRVEQGRFRLANSQYECPRTACDTAVGLLSEDDVEGKSYSDTPRIFGSRADTRL